jgi:hypothetical protein
VPRKTSKRDKTKELFWRKAIARQSESGLSQQAFCQKDGINPNNFSWWKREISRRDSDKVTEIPASSNREIFVPVAHVPNTIHVDSTKAIAEIDLSTGVVRIFAGIDRHALHEMLAVLREVAN